MTAFGQRFATCLRPGDVILLDGDLGTGKTHVARAIIQSRLATSGREVEHVPSPTFTLVQTYDLGDTEIWHTDLYRLSGPDEIAELGLEEAFETGIVLVEWPDRLEDQTPPTALRIQISLAKPHGRHLVLDGGAHWAGRLTGLQAQS